MAGLFRVVLPQLKLAICGGALLVALHLLAEYGLYVMIRFDTFTTAIYDQFQSTFSGPAANMLAGVLALCCLAILLLEGVTRGKARYARIGAGAAREQTRWPLKPVAAVLGQLFFLVLIVLALGVPLIVLCRWIWLGGVQNWMSADLWHSLRQTLMLGVGGALLTTACVIPIARSVSVIRTASSGCWKGAFTSPALCRGSSPPSRWSRSPFTMHVRFIRPKLRCSAYLLMFMPRALINLRAGIARAPVELENVARSLGSTPAKALWSVTMRLAAPGAAAGAALVFLGVSNELTATLLLSPLGTRTLSTGFWALTSEIDYVAAAPYAMLMILISLPLTAILYMQSKNCRAMRCLN